MSENPPSVEGQVTMVVRRYIKRGSEPEYEAWLAETNRVLSHFPGFLSSSIIRPQPGQADNEYIFLPQFENDAAVKRWADSPEREARMASLRPLLASETKFQKLSGLEFWFTPPPGFKGEPPRWKMVFVTLAVMWPLSLVLELLLKPAMGAAAKISPLLAPLVLMVVMIPLVTYWIMPLAVRLFAPWLFPAAQKN